MKNKTFNEEIRKLSAEQLAEKADQLSQQLFSIKLSARTAHVKNTQEFSDLRKNIARIWTELRSRELAKQATK